MTAKEYRQYLIKSILKFQNGDQFTRAELERKTTRTLERIYDNI